MRLLGAGGLPLLEDAARPPDADNPFGYHEYAPVRALARDAGWVAAAEGRAVKVIYTLLPRLPEGPTYRVILMRRDLRAVVASQNRVLVRRGAQPGRLGTERLIAVLGAQMDETRAWLHRQSRITWMELDYDALLRSPEPVLAGLIAFAGLHASPGALARLVVPAHAGRGCGEEMEPAASATGSFDER